MLVDWKAKVTSICVGPCVLKVNALMRHRLQAFRVHLQVDGPGSWLEMTGLVARSCAALGPALRLKPEPAEQPKDGHDVAALLEVHVALLPGLRRRLDQLGQPAGNQSATELAFEYLLPELAAIDLQETYLPMLRGLPHPSGFVDDVLEVSMETRKSWTERRWILGALLVLTTADLSLQ